MADTYTQMWGMAKPEVGASRDSWGAKLNSDLDMLDQLLQALQPIGAMTDFAGTHAPLGWLLCDGSTHPIASFPRLFAVIGNTYGGDGVTTFGVPDARCRSTAGAGSTVGDQGNNLVMGVGEKVGDFFIALSLANLPSAQITTSLSPAHVHAGSVSDLVGPHTHPGTTDAAGLHYHNYGGFALHNGGADFAGGPDTGFLAATTSWDGNHAHTFTAGYAGSHQHSLQIASDGIHSHTFSLNGSNQQVRIVQPLLGTTKIICCGPPSMQTLPSNLTTPSMMVMQSPMRGLN